MRTKVLLPLAVITLALAVRLHALPWPIPLPDPVTEPERVAGALADGRGWSDAFAAGTGPTAHTAPLYPLLLSGVYRLCGDYATQTGRLAQACLSIAVSISILLFFPLLSRKLGLSSAAGWIAAFLRAVSFSEMEIRGSQENVLATLALLALIWCLADLRQRAWSGSVSLLRTGLLLGLIALLAPNFLVVPFLFLLIELGLRSGKRRRILRCGLVLAALSLCLVAPWLVRNYRVLGGFVPLRSNFGLELTIGNRPDADGYTYAPSFAAVHPIANVAERNRLLQMGELAYMRDKQRQALNWIANHPRRFAWLTWRRVELFYVFRPEYGYTMDLGVQSLHFPLLALIPLGLAGELLRLSRRNPSSAVLLACALLGLGLPYFVTHVEWRYRIPLLSLYVLLGTNLAWTCAGWLASKLLALLSADAVFLHRAASDASRMR